jgi:hypothetical protein
MSFSLTRASRLRRIEVYLGISVGETLGWKDIPLLSYSAMGDSGGIGICVRSIDGHNCV